MKRLNEEQIEEIIDLYQNGMMPKAIGEKFGIRNNSVTRILRKNGIERDKLKKVELDTILSIIEKYQSGQSSEIIGENLKLDSSTVLRILKKNNINIRPATENKRKYKINVDYFQSIDNENKAYFLGLLYADGSLAYGGSGIKLTLQAKDADILEKLSNEIYGFQKIRLSTDSENIREYKSVDIYSQKMHEDLVKLGCPPRKSFTITFPLNIMPQDLLKHFIRGYLDGDGCICLANDNRPVIDITSTEQFLVGLSAFIQKELNIDCGKLYQRHPERMTNTRNIQITGIEKIKLFLDYIYTNATIFLNRKRELYNQFLDLYQYKKGQKIEKYINITNYHSTYIPTYNEILLHSDNLIKCDNSTKEEIANYLLQFYRKNGFPYAKEAEDKLIGEFSSFKRNRNSIEENGIIKTYDQSALSIYKHFSPHFYEVNELHKDRLSMLDTFNNNELLLKVIKNRINGNHTIHGNMIKQGLANSRIAFKASVFLPSVAKFIYSKYTKENDIIYDYSMGFGQRLIGALALNHKVKYIGVDPWEKSVKSNQAIFDFFNAKIPGLNKEAEIIQGGAENYTDYIGQVNLAFSSPPYFNIEQYEDNPNQAAYDNSYSNFINVWWRKTVKNITKMLTDDGYFIINIKKELDKFNIAEDMSNVILENGFKLETTYQMQLSKNTIFRNIGGQHKYEPIFVFKKIK